MRHIDIFKRFLIWFTPLILLVWFLLWVSYSANFIEHGYATLSYSLLLLFNVDVVVESNQLINDATGHRIIVDSTCTGLPLLASVGAIILAVTHCYPLYQRLMILSLALIVLVCENVVRISFLFWLLSQLASPKLFDFFHLYIWQLINFLFGLMIIYIVLKYTNNKQKLNSDVVA